MASEDAIEVEGSVVEALSSALYRVELANGHRMLAHGNGRGRQDVVRLLPGEKVKLRVSPYDLSKGVIIWKKKQT